MLDNQLNPPAIYGEAEAGRSAEVRKELEQLVKKQTTETLDMAELLAEVKTQKYYENWGFDTFGLYVHQALDMKERKAQYLVRIIYVQEKMGIPRERLEPVGISKLREICSLDPDGYFVNQKEQRNEPLHEHITRLISEAPTKDLVEINAEVKRLKGLDGDNSMVRVTFMMTKSGKENVYDKALELAAMKLGSAGRDEQTGDAKEYPDGAKVEAICADFIADPNNWPEDQQAETNEEGEEQ